MRTEQEIFDELAALCMSAGYVHALAALCLRDTVVGFAEEMTSQDMAKMFSWDRLIRTELMTLTGLMLRAPIDFTLPAQETIAQYAEQSEKLLSELHQAMLASTTAQFTSENFTDSNFNPFTRAEVLREAIFYAAESAYTFQYRDFASLKYGKDAGWLDASRGIDIISAGQVVRALTNLLNERAVISLEALRSEPPAEWTVLPVFTFSVTELAAASGVSIERVRALTEAFTFPGPEANAAFTSLHAFNAAYAFPFMKRGDNELILLQQYGISEALYEAPFYWMAGDSAYRNTAFAHRGEYTEDLAFERLVHVFGPACVFKNVELSKIKGTKLGEIDVLVLFGNQAVVVQAKAKKLTQEARNGNDLRLQGDFKAAVQDAVDQAFSCANLLLDPAVRLQCLDDTEIPLTVRPTTIYPLTIVADHYPSLAFQARQLLKAKATEAVVFPLVTDVFALDEIAEMLETPLRLLSYLRLRAIAAPTLMMSHEHVLLSYHLKQNLWVEAGTGLLMVSDDFAIELDIAMAARRDDVPGAKIPTGILTKFIGTPFADLLAQIELQAEPVPIALGFFLLELDEFTVQKLNEC